MIPKKCGVLYLFWLLGVKLRLKQTDLKWKNHFINQPIIAKYGAVPLRVYKIMTTEAEFKELNIVAVLIKKS
ncbi:MAG: hypothetical protein LBH74_04305 [Nitrososphaerota archaeon]|jgi:hypothetical protein|nr:hypothetical protein [Nitrososphaerota archaeon]